MSDQRDRHIFFLFRSSHECPTNFRDVEIGAARYLQCPTNVYGQSTNRYTLVVDNIIARVRYMLYSSNGLARIIAFYAPRVYQNRSSLPVIVIYSPRPTKTLKPNGKPTRDATQDNLTQEIIQPATKLILLALRGSLLLRQGRGARGRGGAPDAGAGFLLG